MKEVYITIHDVVEALNREMVITECVKRNVRLVYVPNNGAYIVQKANVFLKLRTGFWSEHFRSFNGNEAVQCFNSIK